MPAHSCHSQEMFILGCGNVEKSQPRPAVRTVAKECTSMYLMNKPLECAVSSVGFLWGSATVSPTCGLSAGPRKIPLTRLANRTLAPRYSPLGPGDHSPDNPGLPGSLPGGSCGRCHAGTSVHVPRESAPPRPVVRGTSWLPENLLISRARSWSSGIRNGRIIPVVRLISYLPRYPTIGHYAAGHGQLPRR